MKKREFKCDFNQLLKILRNDAPDRPTLFEFFMNDRLYRAAKGSQLDGSIHLKWYIDMINVFHYYGYDYVTVAGSSFHFPAGGTEQKSTMSLNARSTIHDRKSFDKYKWNKAEDFDYSALKDVQPHLLEGQKLMVSGPGGVLENVIALVGFDNLCMMLYDDEELVSDIFERVGEGLIKYYDLSARFNSVGLIMSNDDWGFNTQTMLSPKDMQKYVFPYHKRIVQTAHKHGKPVVLHSCGNYSMILDDLLNLGYDGRHSYEDNIIPVENAYEQLNGKIAVLGGIDVNFLINKSEEEIKSRCLAMLERTATRGGYALGSGNSIPDYIPDKKYLAMINTARALRGDF